MWTKCFALLALLLVLALTMLQPATPQALQAAFTGNTPTPVGGALFPTPPGVTPIPTSVHPTPTADAANNAAARAPVSMGPIAAVPVAPAPTRLPYEVMQIATDYTTVGEVAELYLKDFDTGERMRFGDDGGDSLLEIATERYIIWKYYPCTVCSDESERNAGLYAYDRETQSELVLIEANHAQWDPHIDGSWVVYRVSNKDFSNAALSYLHLHNLESGEDILLDTNTYIPRLSIHPEQMYAIHNNSVAWVAFKEGVGIVVRMYDIATGSTTTVHFPGMHLPMNILVSGDVVIWKELVGGWSGYDRTLDHSFAVSFHPPGWEQVPRRYAEPITLANDQLFWAWEVNGQTYRFTAPIVRQGQ